MKENKEEEEEPLVQRQQTPLPTREEQPAPVQQPVQQPKPAEQPKTPPKEEPKEETINVTFTKTEVLKILTVIESNEDFGIAKRLEVENTLTNIHAALYEWFVALPNKE